MIKRYTKKSLWWQWALMIWASLTVCYIVFALIMVNQFEKKALQLTKNEATQIIEQTNTYFKDKNFQTLDAYKLFFEHNTSLEKTLLMQRLAQNDIHYRIVDRNETVVFESKPLMPLTATKLNDTTSLNGIIAVVKTTLPLEQVYTVHYYIGNTTVKQHKEKVHYYAWLYSLLIIFSIGCIAIALAYYFFKPIKHMSDIMAIIKKDAESKQRMVLSHKRYGELTELSNGFNDLLDTMERYINQQKQFVEDVSHELRTPVAIVEGHLKLLSRWGKDDPIVLSESLEASLFELERMKTLVQEMLDLSRAEQVGIQYKHEITEVSSLVKQVHQNFELIHDNFAFTLDMDMDNMQNIFVNVSRHHLEQVLIILLDNAVKYSTDKPYIHITVSKTISNVQISVKDFGEGISTTDLPKVFGRFYRVDKARSRHKGGNGLGLSIAKELVEGYGGNITVDSVINSGSTFRIELPIMLDNTKIVQAKRKQEG